MSRSASRRRSSWFRRSLAALGALVLVAGLAVAGSVNAPEAHALDLPTWDDVQEAKQNQASADKKIKEVEKLISDGEKELERLRNLHSTTIEELQQAEEALAKASQKAEKLQSQADAAREEAEEAAAQAGVIVAQMYRSGGVDRSMELFLDSDESTADALLERMASMSKATERNTKISEEAEQAANTAKSLGKQADVAKEEREELRADKQAKEQAAAEAVTDQGEKVREQEEQQRDLEVKLEALKDKTTKTVEGYQERLRIEEEQRRKEEERLRREAEERARQQQEQGGGGGAPPPPPVSPPGGGGGGGGGGVSNGWTIPTAYSYVSEGFRSPGRWDHTGIDLAAPLGTPIVAAASGTVALTYWDGCGGNMVSINHTNGWQTRYAHMNTWAVVSPGQSVGAGQVVGYVGTTGCSTGPHLHFEMRPNQDNGWYDFVNPAHYIAF